MDAISDTELRIILCHVRDYDVIKLDGELPHLKEKSSIMKEHLQKSYENILGPFCKLDELLLDKISSYVEPRWLENLDRAALELSRRSEYMREKIEAHQKANRFFCKNCGGRCAERWQMVEHTNRWSGKYRNGCTVIFPPLSARPRKTDDESYHSYMTSS